MLEDTTSMGVFDKPAVFARGYCCEWAEWHDGALYVCSAPYIWRFAI